MIRIAASLLLLLVGCAAPPRYPVDVLYARGVSLPVRVDDPDDPRAIGQTDGRSITLAPRLSEAPPIRGWFTMQHERCHVLLDDETETEADCCATARLHEFGLLAPGSAAEVALVSHFQARGMAQRAATVLQCAP